MEENEIETRVKRIICDILRIQPYLIEKTTDISTDLLADSLDEILIRTEIEKEFAIAIPDESAAKLCTILDYVNYILTMLK